MSTLKSIKLINFKKNANEIVGKMWNLGEFSDVTLVSEDKRVIQAHKVVLAPKSMFFRDMLRSVHHAHPVIFMRGVKSTCIISLMEIIYKGETKVNEEDSENFLKVVTEMNVKEIEQNQEKIKNKIQKVCNFHNRGFCNDGEKYSFGL